MPAAGANIVVCIFNQEEHSPGTRQDRHRSTPVSLCDHFRAHEARPVDEASFANREHKEDHAFWPLLFPGTSHPSPMPNRRKCWYISGFFPRGFHQQLIVNMFGIDDVIGKGYKSKSSGSVQREPQHTPAAYFRPSQTPKWGEFLYKLLVGGMFQGMLEKFLQIVSFILTYHYG